MSDPITLSTVRRGLPVPDAADSPEAQLFAQLAAHYTALPGPVREAFLLTRLAAAQIDLAAGNQTLHQAFIDLADLGRAHAAQIVAADLELQTRMRLERRIADLEHQAAQYADDQAHAARAISHRETRIADLEAQLRARADQVVIIGAVTPAPEPEPAEPTERRTCPYCGNWTAARSNQPFTADSLPKHIRRCPDNPNRWTRGRAPEPEPPEPEPADDRRVIWLADEPTEYVCPQCGGTAFARAIRGDRCVRCAQADHQKELIHGIDR